MLDADQIRKHVPVPVVRALTALGFVVAFLAVAALLKPAKTIAEDDQPLAAQQTGARTLAPSITYPAYIGSLSGDDARVEVFITPNGPRYTVVSNDSNEILAELLSADEMEAQFPDLAPESLNPDVSSH